MPNWMRKFCSRIPMDKPWLLAVQVIWGSIPRTRERKLSWAHGIPLWATWLARCSSTSQGQHEKAVPRVATATTVDHTPWPSHGKSNGCIFNITGESGRLEWALLSVVGSASWASFGPCNWSIFLKMQGVIILILIYFLKIHWLRKKKRKKLFMRSD